MDVLFIYIYVYVGKECDGTLLLLKIADCILSSPAKSAEIEGSFSTQGIIHRKQK